MYSVIWGYAVVLIVVRAHGLMVILVAEVDTGHWWTLIDTGRHNGGHWWTLMETGGQGMEDPWTPGVMDWTRHGQGSETDP